MQANVQSKDGPRNELTLFPQSDFNTGGFTYRTSQLHSIDFHTTKMVVRYAEYPGVGMKGVLRKLAQRIDVGKLSVVPGPRTAATRDISQDNTDTPITQAWMWPRVSSYLREDDVVVTDTGTSNFGILTCAFPKGVTALNQMLWGSIGWATPAAQGAALALRDMGMEKRRRTILFSGDGSFQLTAQEVSTIVRHNLPVTM